MHGVCFSAAPKYSTSEHWVENAPYLGASPDGNTTCECCGKEYTIITCPYNAREYSPEEATGSIDCLELSDGGLHLIKIRAYYKLKFIYPKLLCAVRH